MLFSHYLDKKNLIRTNNTEFQNDNQNGAVQLQSHRNEQIHKTSEGGNVREGTSKFYE